MRRSHNSIDLSHWYTTSAAICISIQLGMSNDNKFSDMKVQPDDASTEDSRGMSKSSTRGQFRYISPDLAGSSSVPAGFMQ